MNLSDEEELQLRENSKFVSWEVAMNELELTISQYLLVYYTTL